MDKIPHLENWVNEHVILFPKNKSAAPRRALGSEWHDATAYSARIDL